MSYLWITEDALLWWWIKGESYSAGNIAKILMSYILRLLAYVLVFIIILS